MRQILPIFDTILQTGGYLCADKRSSRTSGRTGPVPLWHADDEFWSGGRRRRPDEEHFGTAHRQPVPGRAGGRGDHRRHPVLFRHHRHGGGLRQRRAHDPEPGRLDHHGRQHRHHDHRPAHRPGRGGHGAAVRFYRRGAGGLCEKASAPPCGPDPGRSWRAVHRHGHDERRDDAPALGTCLPGADVLLCASPAGHPLRRGVHRRHPVLLRLCGHFADPLRQRRHLLPQRYSCCSARTSAPASPPYWPP